MNQLINLLRLAHRGVILDTNVFLVYLIGLIDPEKISEFKRTASYSREDFEVLARLLQLAPRIVTTPHVLTEACNLTDSANRKYKGEIFFRIRELLEDWIDRRQESYVLAGRPEFLRLGLADLSLLDASLSNHLVITDEAECFAAITSARGLCLNLNHIRGQLWLDR